MPVEVAKLVDDFNKLWPRGTDPVSKADDHIRMIKEVLQLEFELLYNKKRVFSFEAGAVVNPDCILYYEAEKAFYHWNGAYDVNNEYIVNAGSTPETAGGIRGNAWTRSTGSGFMSTVLVSDTEPTAPFQNMLWWDTNSGIFFIYYNDGTSTQWVDLFGIADQSTFNTLLFRSILARLAAESGYTLVDGSFQEGAVSSGFSDVVLDWNTAKFYQWHLNENKEVPAGSTPATTGGVGAGTWVDRTQETLRSELAASNGYMFIPSIVPKVICSTVEQIHITMTNSTHSVVDIYLNDVVFSSVLTIPASKAVRFYGNASIQVDNAIQRVIGENDTTFLPIEFVDGRITIDGPHQGVYVKVPWSSNTRRPIVVHDGFEFNLKNGATALHLTGGFFHLIDGTHTLDATSYLIHADSSAQQIGDTSPVCAMNVTIGATVIGGNLIRYTKTQGTPWYQLEGLVFTDKFHSYACKIIAQHINGMICNAQILESSSFIMDSCVNSSWSPKYADTVVNGDWLLKVMTTKGDSFSINISPDILQSNHATGFHVLFDETGGESNEIYNVSYDAKIQQGGGNNVAVYGVTFIHRNMRNFNASGNQSFSHMAAPFRFEHPIYRSSISKFEARDVGAYAVNMTAVFPLAWPTYFNRFDSLYVQLDGVNISYPTFIGNAVAERVGGVTIPISTMQRAPVVSVYPSTVYPSSVTLSITSYENLLSVGVNKGADMVSPDRVVWEGSLVLDATQYIAPR